MNDKQQQSNILTREVFRNGIEEAVKNGCSNHNCIITGPKNGQGTNSSCRCKRFIMQWLESLEEITRTETK